VCGILGVILQDPEGPAAAEICDGLSLLQHRGQDACGIVTCGHKGRFYQCKANGMVRDVFDPKSVAALIGGMGIGHGMCVFFPSRPIGAYLDCTVRYPTAGSFAQSEAQPFYVNSPYGIVFAHVSCRVLVLLGASPRSTRTFLRTETSSTPQTSNTSLMPMPIDISTLTQIQRSFLTCSPITFKKPGNFVSTRKIFSRLLETL